MIIKLRNDLKEKPKILEWGTIFSDHMLFCDYKDNQWGEIQIVPHGTLDLYPETVALHYGQSVFEGMKAFKNINTGKIQMVRPKENLLRLNKSQSQICIPTFSDDKLEEIFQGLKQLIKIDKDWVYDYPNSLYVRPFSFASEPFLGLKPASEYKFMIIMTPVPEYFSGSIKLWVPENYVRTVKGSVGTAKVSGNYAAGLLPLKIAHEKGFDQVLFLDGEHKKYIEECGAMNFFCVINDILITPNLDSGTILHGITRQSILDWARFKGYNVEERPITINELIASSRKQTLQECFVCGTAAVVASVDELQYKEYTIKPKYPIGELTKEIHNYIVSIQYGKVKDELNWVVKIN